MIAEKISPTVTVIITDGGSNRACVESILAQPFEDIEIILVGDKPTIALNDPRIKIVSGKKNLNAARNAGLNEASGKYVCLLDGDGWMYANGLLMMLDAAESSGADIVRVTTFVERDGNNQKSVSDRNLLALNFYRREFIERCSLRFPESTDDEESFLYAAECCASSVEIFNGYCYVRDRKKKHRAESEEIYVKDIERDEIRCGFLVTTQRKKLWNAQIKIIREFARICRKYNLKWFAYCGTLIGAARHGGYVPWDDDVDLGMLRPDFETFKRIAPKELGQDFSFDPPYNYAIEGESNDENLPVISLATIREIRERGWLWPIISDFIKIRDNRTAMIQWPARRHVNQGVWIDIFPFDPVPPFAEDQHYVNFEIGRELMLAASYPDVLTSRLDRGEQTVLSEKFLRELLKKPFKQRALAFQERLARTYFKSPNIGRPIGYYLFEKMCVWSSTYLRDTIELPFEASTIQVPIDYDAFLTTRYGDWHELIMQKSHVTAVTADIPYKKFFEQVSPAIKEFNF